MVPDPLHTEFIWRLSQFPRQKLQWWDFSTNFKKEWLQSFSQNKAYLRNTNILTWRTARICFNSLELGPIKELVRAERAAKLINRDLFCCLDHKEIREIKFFFEYPLDIQWLIIQLAKDNGVNKPKWIKTRPLSLDTLWE